MALVQKYWWLDDFNNLFTYSIEQIPSWEAKRFSATQTPRILQYPKLHYKNLPPVPILSQINLVHASQSHFLIIHLNFILPSMLGLSKWSLSPPKPCVHFSCPPPIHATCPAHLIILDLITWIIFGKGYKSSRSSLCTFRYSPVTSSLIGPNIFLSTLSSNTLNLCSSFSVSDQAWMNMGLNSG